MMLEEKKERKRKDRTYDREYSIAPAVRSERKLKVDKCTTLIARAAGLVVRHLVFDATQSRVASPL